MTRHQCCLQACTHLGQNPLDIKILELNTVHSRTATPGPFILASVLCMLQPTTSATCLIRWLQHSILGLWLRATQAGVPLACHQTISSPHVHPIVRRALLSLIRNIATPRFVYSGRLWLRVNSCDSGVYSLVSPAGRSLNGSTAAAPATNVGLGLGRSAT